MRPTFDSILWILFLQLLLLVTGQSMNKDKSLEIFGNAEINLDATDIF